MLSVLGKADQPCEAGCGSKLKNSQSWFWCIKGWIVISGNLYPELAATQPIERDAIYRRRRFPREVIDRRRDPEPTTAGKRVGYEVDRSAQIARLRDSHGRPGAQSPLAAAPSARAQISISARSQRELSA